MEILHKNDLKEPGSEDKDNTVANSNKQLNAQKDSVFYSDISESQLETSFNLSNVLYPRRLFEVSPSFLMRNSYPKYDLIPTMRFTSYSRINAYERKNNLNNISYVFGGLISGFGKFANNNFPLYFFKFDHRTYNNQSFINYISSFNNSYNKFRAFYTDDDLPKYDEINNSKIISSNTLEPLKYNKNNVDEFYPLYKEYKFDFKLIPIYLIVPNDSYYADFNINYLKKKNSFYTFDCKIQNFYGFY